MQKIFFDTMATKKKVTKKQPDKKRLIVRYERLPEQAQELFDKKYEDGYSDYVEHISMAAGSHLYVVPLETEDADYLVKVDVVVDSSFNEDDLDKDSGNEQDKESTDDIDVSQDGEIIKSQGSFKLNHGDYSSFDNIESTAREDMGKENFTSLDDVDAVDESTLDL